jgi:hypothetical protein
MYFWFSKANCLSNLFVKLTLIHDDIFVLQVIDFWSHMGL